MFTGTSLSHGNSWHDEVIKGQGGSLQYDKCFATVRSWGKYTKAKSIGHLEYKQKGETEVESEESDIYIMEKYWNHYIGDSDDSMSLIEYLQIKIVRKSR